MFGRYRNKRRKHINGFFVACATAKETGLLYDVLIDSLGSDSKFPGCPRVGVVVGDFVVPVKISEKPVVLSGYDFYKDEEVLEWVAVHKMVLLQHWNKELSDRELLNALSKK